jgi:hypothetical protein
MTGAIRPPIQISIGLVGIWNPNAAGQHHRGHKLHHRTATQGLPEGQVSAQVPCEDNIAVEATISRTTYNIKAISEVLFDSVEIREYHHMLSDNPTSSGAPIGIGWRFGSRDSIRFNLDEYECFHKGLPRTRKKLSSRQM